MGFCLFHRKHVTLALMELSERWLQIFEAEGFASVYEWSDPAGTMYPPHNHQGKVSLFVTDGSCQFDFDGRKVLVSAGTRFDVPVGELHSAVVGELGWNVVVGEEIEGDS
jgi:mannose-6-phosphate isomerase-like protein (cupin superfamily)